MEITENGSLDAAITLPNLIVGTVGGGTSLPTQKECLKIMIVTAKEKLKSLPK